MDVLNLRRPQGCAFSLTSNHCVFCRTCATHSFLPKDSSEFADSTVCCQCLLILGDALAALTEAPSGDELRPPTLAQNQASTVDIMVFEFRESVRTNTTPSHESPIASPLCPFCDDEGRFFLLPPVSSAFPSLFCQKCMHTLLRVRGLLMGETGPATTFLTVLEEQSAVTTVEELLGLPERDEWRAV